jgi:hypothetical protein
MRKSQILLLAALAALGSAEAVAASIEQAQAAYGVYDVKVAEALYASVSKDPQASAKDRASAKRELARIAWLVDGNRAKALGLLEQSLPGDPDPCPAAHLYARILNDGAQHSPTPSKLSPFAAACQEVEPGVAVEAVRSRLLEAAASPPRFRKAKAAAALAEWKKLPRAARSGLAATRLQLAIGLVSKDATQALEGWRSYFWLENGQAAPQALGISDAGVISAFAKGLLPEARREDSLALARVLLRAGFYDEFRRLAADHDLERTSRARDESWRPFATYIGMRESLMREILAHDRAYARAGAAEEHAYEKRLQAILADAAVALGGDGNDPMPTLHAAYGLWGTAPGRTNGVSGIHLGHMIVDERQKVAQDGRDGSIRFIVLDNMIHNSFSAWLMDGVSAPGGWAENGSTIIQVRPRFLHSIDSFARLASEGKARSRALAEMEEQRKADRAIASKTPVAFLPGVRARLRLQGIDLMAAQVRRALPAGSDFDLALRKAYWSALIDSSITAHEGRHVLDQAEFRGRAELSADELEYRAKLSEIRFAPRPLLALSSIYSPLFGGESGHGIANKRLMADFARWIAANKARIAGYDPALTELEQLDKLSEAQIVAIAESLDPAVSRK